MGTFSLEVPFRAGESWVRRNFFSLDMRDIGPALQLVSCVSDTLPTPDVCNAERLELRNELDYIMPVVQIHIALSNPAKVAGQYVITINIDVEGEIIPCDKASDACDGGSSG